MFYKNFIEPVDPYFSSQLFFLALIFRLIGSAMKYIVATQIYESGDMMRYHAIGHYISQHFEKFDFSILGSLQGPQGTANLTYFTGLLYTFLPTSLPGSCFFFSTLAFIGSILFYQSFRFAFPDTAPNFFRLVIFFLPSILFWPSSLGKDAWIFLSSGLVAYGFIKYLRTANLSGLLLASIGIVLTWIIRPHIASIMLIAAGLTYFFFARMRASQHLVIWMIGGVCVVGLGIFVLRSTGEFLGGAGLQDTSLEGVEDFYDFRQRGSTEGHSAFKATSVFSPLGAIYGVITILFRPFPWEAHNPQALVSSMESILWLGIMWYRRKVFFSRICSTIANFGIIARQRVMFLPFLLMLFA
jgi:hypothetical protein